MSVPPEAGMSCGEPARVVQQGVLRPRWKTVGCFTGKCGGAKHTQKWVGNDIPDFKADSKPADHMGPFIHWDAVRSGTSVRRHLERLRMGLSLLCTGESTDYLLHPKQDTNNPIAKKFKSRRTNTALRRGYDIVCRRIPADRALTHYWTKNNPMNVQLVPEPFVEIPEEMAQERGFWGATA